MKILQQPVKVKRGTRVIINFSEPTAVYLMTEVNFKRYKDGSSYRRLGGDYSESPVEFTAPYDGTWHAVIEKGTHTNPTNVTGSVELLPRLRKESTYFDAEEEWKSDHPQEDGSETTLEDKTEVLDEVETDVSEESESNRSDDDHNEEEDEEKD